MGLTKTETGRFATVWPYVSEKGGYRELGEKGLGYYIAINLYGREAIRDGLLPLKETIRAGSTPASSTNLYRGLA